MENVAVTDDELAEVERLIFTASGGGPSTFDRNNAAHGLLDYTKRLVAEVRASRGRIALAAVEVVAGLERAEKAEAECHDWQIAARGFRATVDAQFAYIETLRAELAALRAPVDVEAEVRALVVGLLRLRPGYEHLTVSLQVDPGSPWGRDMAEIERLVRPHVEARARMARENERLRGVVGELVDTLGAVDVALPPRPLGSPRRSYPQIVADVEAICADESRALHAEVVTLRHVVEEARRAASTVRRLVVAAESELTSLSLSPILRALLTLDERLSSQPSSTSEHTVSASLVAESRSICAAAAPGPWGVDGGGDVGGPRG